MKKISLIFILSFLFIITACDYSNKEKNNVNSEIIITVKDSFPLEYVVGSDIPNWIDAVDIKDKEGNTISSEKINIDTSNVDMNTIGTFVVKYEIEGNNGKNTTKIITVTIIAREHTITFVSNGGSSTNNLTLREGTELSLPVPTKEGYTFDKWYKDESLTEEFTGTTVPSNDITLYAKWIINSYTITFNTNGGSTIDPLSKAYGETLSIPTPTKDNMIFDGWYADEACTTKFTQDSMPANNLTLYAKWEDHQHTISLNTNGGDAIDDLVVNVGDSLTLPTPKRVGYTFEGWFTNVVLTEAFSQTIMSDNDITVFAKWSFIPTQGLEYVLNESGTAYSISGYSGTSKVISIPKQYHSLPVTRIEEGAFEVSSFFEDSTITDVVFEENSSITYIGQYSFAFTQDLTSITLPESVTIIDDYAFYNSGLNNIHLSSHITNIGEGAFELTNLTNVDLPQGITTIASYTFAWTTLTTITIPNSVTTIGDSAFNGSELATINLPSSIISIGNSAFAFTKLTSITIPESMIIIDNYAFEYTKLTSVTIPSSVLRIGNSAFISLDLCQIDVDNNNPNYTSVDGVLYNKDLTTLHQYPEGKEGTYTLPASVVEIKDNAITGYKLTGVFVESNNPNYSSIDGVLYNKDQTSLLLYPLEKTNKDYTLPESVTSIIDYSFGRNGILENINVESNNTTYSSIDGVLFNKDQTTLITYPTARTTETYSVPNTVETLDIFAFASSQLKTLTLPSSISTLSYFALAHSTNLEKIILNSDIPPVIENDFTEYFPDLPSDYMIFVPQTSLDAYRLSEYWIEYSSHIYSNEFINGYKINFITSEGYSITPMLFNAGDTLSLPMLVEPGYNFKGWFTDEAFTQPFTMTVMPEQDFTLYAKWEFDPYYGLGFMLNANGTYTISNYNGDTIDELIIPNSYNGILVTKIGNHAFNNNRKINKVILPNTITEIGNYAFQSSTLSEINIPNSVLTIGNNAFSSCLLEKLIIEDNSQLESIGDYAFTFTGLYTITIPESVDYIGINAFYDIRNLTKILVEEYNANYSSVNGVLFNKDNTILLQYPSGKLGDSYTIPNSVITLSSSAFGFNYYLKNIYIPNSFVGDISSNTFYYTESLESINVASDNPKYTSVDGVLFNKEMTVLIKYPNNKSLSSYIIPDSVTQLYRYSMAHAERLTSITLGVNLSNIGEDAIGSMINLRSINVVESNNYFASIDGVLYSKDLSKLIKYPNDKSDFIIYEVPNTVSIIETNAFKGNQYLLTLTLPDTITQIGGYGLAFSNIEDIIINATTPPTIGELALYSDFADYQIYVPLESVETYKADWSFYADKIYSIDDLTLFI